MLCTVRKLQWLFCKSASFVHLVYHQEKEAAILLLIFFMFIVSLQIIYTYLHWLYSLSIFFL